MEITQSGLYTDFYELTMAQGYFRSGKINAVATFDLYFRTAPFSGGYGVFAGLAQSVQSALAFSYSADDIAYLRSLGFHDDFLAWLSALSNINIVARSFLNPIAPALRPQ